jgi:transcriptional regulator
MYVPKDFELAGHEELVAFLRAHSFGILVSANEGKLFATHAPFVVLDDGKALTLGLHVAKANPHWHSLQDAEVLAIFQGAHDFISASWYADPQHSVPTWNYSTVHCAGKASLAEDAVTERILEMLVREFEGEGRWSMHDTDGEYIDRMKRGIVGLTIAVTSIKGKLKYSQNRSEEDRSRILSHLDESSPELAHDMREYYRAKRDD